MTPTLFADKRKTPRECVHEVWQPVRMGSAIELADVEHVRLVFEDRGFVIVYVKVVWRGKERHDGWETGCACLAVHPVPRILRFVRTNDTQ